MHHALVIMDSMHHHTCALEWLVFTASKKTRGISRVLIRKKPKVSQILL